MMLVQIFVLHHVQNTCCYRNWFCNTYEHNVVKKALVLQHVRNNWFYNISKTNLATTFGFTTFQNNVAKTSDFAETDVGQAMGCTSFPKRMLFKQLVLQHIQQQCC